MRGRLLTMLLLLGGAGLARAEYIVIIANLHAQVEQVGGTGGAPGGEGTGMLGGGFPPMGGGMLGGGRPGMGGPGMGGPGMGGPGMIGGRGGMLGGPPPSGGGGLIGRPGGGGMLGGGGLIGGSPPMGSGGGGLMGGGGMPGEGGGSEALDDAPYIVVAVLEVYDLGNKLKLFKQGHPLPLRHRFGQTIFAKKTYRYDAYPLEGKDGKLVPSVHIQFQQRMSALKANPPTDALLTEARWALEHGLLNDFTKVMERIAETDKTNPAVAAYLKVKDELAKPLSNEDVAGQWKSKILDGYKITQSDNHHFALLHNQASDSLNEVKPQLDRLEKSFKSFYYWWALRGIVLPIPTERQVAILTERTDDFRRLKKHLSSSPDVADSFFARREGLAVFANKRGDDNYVTMEKYTKPEWDKGYVRNEIMSTYKTMRGVPKGTKLDDTLMPRTYAVIMKSMEDEWEATSMSHEAARQLAYASGLLPRKVHVPEWVQFGIGSFFETPLQTPWGGVGAASSYWMPRFKEYYKDKKYNRLPGNLPNSTPSSVDALTKVVTDAGFREPSLLGGSQESTQRRARSAAWALTYFLAQRELPGLQKYFKELGRLPRDVELDEKVLLTRFARAFDCVNQDGSVNQAKLRAFADRWISFINSQNIQGEGIHNQLREYYKQATNPQQQRPGQRPPGGAPPGGGGGGSTG